MKIYAGFFKNTLDLYPADVYVVVDVLRFSTTTSVALDLGVKEVHVYADLSQAVMAAEELKAPLIAEVEGFKPAEADLDNSPIEVIKYFSAEKPEKAVIRTTSGALIIEEAVRRGLKNVVVGGIVNADAVATYLSRTSIKSATIVMAGYKRSMFAVDDLLGAGAIIAELAVRDSELELMTDEAVVAYELYAKARREGRIEELVRSGRAGRFLAGTGRSADAEYSARPNIIHVVPRLKPGTRSVIRAQPK